MNNRSITLEGLKKARRVLGQNSVPQLLPFQILMHSDNAAKLVPMIFGVELDLDENGRQQIENYEIVLINKNAL